MSRTLLRSLRYNSEMGYLGILGIFLIISVFLKRVYKIDLFDSRRQAIVILLTFFVIGTLWDTYAVYSGHWFFNEDNLIGIKIGFLPIEEYVFFLVVPLFIITLYRVLRLKVARVR